MRKTLIEGVLDTIIMTVLGFATLWLFRVDGELLVMAMAFGTYGIIGALVFDDWLYKRLKFPKLLNWQDRTGAVMAFVADEAALVAVYSETMPLFRMCSAVSVSFGAGAFVWFWKVYTPSVMKLEQRDLYDRKNYEGSRGARRPREAGEAVFAVPAISVRVEYYPAKAVMERDPDKAALPHVGAVRVLGCAMPGGRLLIHPPSVKDASRVPPPGDSLSGDTCRNGR